MNKNKMILKSAYELVKQNHSKTKPNVGFFEQLIELECKLLGIDESECSMNLKDYRKSSIKKWIS